MNGLLKTLIKPDWDENPKRSIAIHAANLIQVGEFQLLQLAYKAWYNEDLLEDKINNIFNEYMVTAITPIWVTDYANNIIKLDKANLLEGNNEKYHIYDHEFGEFVFDSKQRKRRGIFYTTIIGLVFISSYFFAIKFSGESASFYPPYVEKQIVFPELYNKSKD